MIMKKIHKIIQGVGEYPSEDERIWCHLGMHDGDYEGSKDWSKVTCKHCLRTKPNHEKAHD